jgi:hypothetical protein
MLVPSSHITPYLPKLLKTSPLQTAGPCVSGLVGLDVPVWSVFGDTGTFRDSGQQLSKQTL